MNQTQWCKGRAGEKNLNDPPPPSPLSNLPSGSIIVNQKRGVSYPDFSTFVSSRNKKKKEIKKKKMGEGGHFISKCNAC